MVDSASNRPTPFTFNKQVSVDFTKFNGISKENLINRANGNETQLKLIDSIFKKHDTNGDGILTNAEFAGLETALRTAAKGDGGDLNAGGDLKRFNESLGVGKKDFSIDDVQGILVTMLNDTDDITGVQDLDDGNLAVTYKPADDNSVTTKTYAHTDNPDEPLRLLTDSVVSSNNATTTITTYNDDGKTIKGKTRITGSVTEELDPNNGDRVIKKTTNKGNGLVEVINYEYTQDGVTETYTENGQTSKIIKKEVKDGVATTTEYTADGTTLTKKIEVKDGVTTTTTYENGKPATVTVSEGGTVKSTTVNEYDDGGSLVTVKEYEGEQAEGATPKSTTVKAKEGKDWGSATFDGDGTTKVSTNGKNWYQIVQEQFPAAKDHKTIMAIVHSMKDKLGVDYKQSSMPAEISIPKSVTVGDKVYTISAATATNATVQEAPVVIINNDNATRPEEVVDEPVAHEDEPPASDSVEPIVDNGYITNMSEVLLSLEGVTGVEQGETGIEVNLQDGRTIEVGNTPEELDRIKTELGVRVESNPVPRSETLSVAPDPRTDLEGYLAQDTVYQGFLRVQNSVNSRIAELEERYGITPGDDFGVFQITDQNDKSDYTRYGLLRGTLIDNLNAYKTTMQNWQDGIKFTEVSWTATGRGTHVYTNVESITLPNGQKAYKTDQGTFFPRENGKIGDQKVPENLLPKDE